MSNATTPTNIQCKPLDRNAEVELQLAAVRVYRGRAVGCIDGTGYTRPIVYTGTTYRFQGVSLGDVDNSAGSAGDKTVRVATRGLFKFTCTATIADVKKTVWFQDDNSVSTTQGSSVIPAGVIENVDSDGGVWIRIQPFGTNEVKTSTDFGAGPVLSDVFASSTASTALSLNQTGATPVILGTTSVTGVKLFADQPILDSSGNELLKFVKTASAVNEVTFTNQATGVAPSITATGETNVGLRIGAKAAATVMFNQLPTAKRVITTVSTTGARDITAAEILGGMFIYSGAGAATFTTETGTQLCTALPGYATGDSFEVEFRNTGNNTLTIAGGVGVTAFTAGTMTIATLSTRRFLFINTGANTWALYPGLVALH